MTQFASRPGPAAVVERLGADEIVGWVEVGIGAGAPPVELYVDELRVATAFADEDVARSADDAVRGFRFALDELWDFVGPRNRLRVRLGPTTLAIAGHGTYATPQTVGTRTVDELARRLAAGEVFGTTGRLQLPKSLDESWQRAVLALYTQLRAELADPQPRVGLADPQLLLAYGTLLGAVRENGFIGRDLDFDAALIVAPHDAAAAARALQQIAFTLIDRGFAVHADATHLRVSRPDAPGIAVDLFHLYFDEDDVLRFPHGVAGRGPGITRDAWAAPVERRFADTSVLVPAAPEAFLEHVYGPAWHTPDPTFRWTRDRTEQAIDAVLAPSAIEEIYWADFYARTAFTSGSTFFELVATLADLPRTVVDIGCGDGRDSYAFASAGWRVTGLDRSHVGVRQATRKAEKVGYDDRLTFTACDVGDGPTLRAALQGARTGDAAMVFYARFFLHSIPEDVQRILMDAVADCARPGDWFAAEFRTDRDASSRKVHGDHYRRFQNGAAFGRSLREAYGFTPVLEQEGNGFSPYRGEDPQLYRVLARRG